MRLLTFLSRRRNVLTLAVLLLLAVTAGCATVGAWQQEGKTETQMKKDEWDCAREVQSMFPWDRTKMFRLCMGARGWKEVGR